MQLRKRNALTLLAPTRAVASVRYRLSAINAEPASNLPSPVIEKLAPRDDDFRHLSFTFAVIALSARVATASGRLSREKYVAFRAAFPLDGALCGKLRKLFVLACENARPFEHYVTQIKHTFPRQLDLFVSLTERLFSIAAADGDITREDERMLARIAHLLELSPAEYTAIRDRYTAPRKPHEVLGVEKCTRMTAIKKRYHTLMRQYHPDRFANQDISPEVDMLLRLKVSEINEAYRTLSKKA